MIEDEDYLWTGDLLWVRRPILGVAKISWAENSCPDYP